MTEVFESHPPSSDLRQGHVYKAYKSAFDKSKAHKILKGRELLNYFPTLFKGASIGRTQADMDDGLFLIRGVRVKQPVEVGAETESRDSLRESARPHREEMQESRRGDRFFDARWKAPGHMAPPSAPRAMRQEYAMRNGQTGFSMAPPSAPARHSGARNSGARAERPSVSNQRGPPSQSSSMAARKRPPHSNPQTPASSSSKKV